MRVRLSFGINSFLEPIFKLVLVEVEFVITINYICIFWLTLILVYLLDKKFDSDIVQTNKIL